MADIFNVAGKTAAELWREIEGFTHPNCPECGNAADLDDDGYWCIHCSDANAPNPAVDSIPNGAEFDAMLAAYHAVRQAEIGGMIGKQFRFNYPAAFKTLPDYTAHAGQVVTVIRQLTTEECDPECQPMFEVRAEDGWTGHADDSELAEL